jgi:RNA polymerase sigma factor for flagellar operon FliA
MSETRPLQEPEAPPEIESGAVDALWRRWHEHQDGEAREGLIHLHLPFARMVAATLYARRTSNDVEFGDYLQLASIGMIEAMSRFDPGRGIPFRIFAAKRVQGAVLNGLIRLTEMNQQINAKMRLRDERLEAAKEMARERAEAADPVPSPARRADQLFRYLAEVGIGVALGILLEDTGMVDADAFQNRAEAPSPEISYFRKAEMRQLRSVLHDFVGQLSPQQQSVIRQHYLQEVPFDEIASRMGVTRGRISQLHRQGLLRLRELLADDARCDVSL